MKETKAVHIIGKAYFLMSPLELDAELCSWVFATKKQKFTLQGM